MQLHIAIAWLWPYTLQLVRQGPTGPLSDFEVWIAGSGRRQTDQKSLIRRNKTLLCKLFTPKSQSLLTSRHLVKRKSFTNASLHFT